MSYLDRVKEIKEEVNDLLVAYASQLLPHKEVISVTVVNDMKDFLEVEIDAINKEWGFRNTVHHMYSKRKLGEFRDEIYN